MRLSRPGIAACRCYGPMAKSPGGCPYKWARTTSGLSKGARSLVGRSSGVLPGHVVVIGVGIVGTSAVRIAVGLGTSDSDQSDVDRLRMLDDLYGAHRDPCDFRTPPSSGRSEADVVIGAGCWSLVHGRQSDLPQPRGTDAAGFRDCRCGRGSGRLL